MGWQEGEGVLSYVVVLSYDPLSTEARGRRHGGDRGTLSDLSVRMLLNSTFLEP